jgi:inosine/xanthosine triphosphatase
MTAPALPDPLAGIERVGVGSRNEPKVAAVRAAIGAYAPRATVQGLDVPSGVPEQPVGWGEIIRGARNRAEAAFAAGVWDLAVGIEDGLVPLPAGAASASGDHVNLGCAAVWDGVRMSLGFSSGFGYPPDVAAAAVAGREPIGELFDRRWRASRGECEALPSARTSGNVGKLTAGALPRSEYARHAVLCALVPFVNPDLYPEPAPEPGA